ncbi:MAG: hypothetical protein KC609_09685 [Myxococcales bacterium]|nr:hypothetical protein [Myxococcales bacterium]
MNTRMRDTAGMLDITPRRRAGYIVLLGVWLFSVGCIGGLESRSKVKDLRFLGLRADPPEIIISSADDPIPPFDVTALLVDPSGTVISAPLMVWACPPTQSGRCDNSEQRRLVHESTASIGDVTVSIQLDLAFMTKLYEADKYKGLGGLTVLLHWQFGPIAAAKLMVFGYPQPEGRQPNRNPAIADITFDGETVFGPKPLNLPGDAEIEVIPTPVEGSQESYPLVTFTGEVRDERERIVYNWYATEGGFSPDESGGRKGILGSGETDVDPKTTWNSPDDYTGEVTFWVVIRDERGGSSWRSFTANVIPGATVTK